MIRSFQSSDHFFPLLFPENFKTLKSFDIALREGGGERSLNRERKCDQQTDRQTDKHMDISTDRKNWPRGPIL